jgi:hypothetical protein
MVDPDPALGIAVDFDGDGFRAAIRFAMQMGTIPDPARRPKFILKSGITPTYTKNGSPVTSPRLDRDGKPLDPNVRVVTGADREVEVDCAVEVTRADAEEGPVGNFRPTKVVDTLLDEQYALVVGARELIYNADRYVFGYEPESNGLFDVGVYTMIFYPRDES